MRNLKLQGPDREFRVARTLFVCLRNVCGRKAAGAGASVGQMLDFDFNVEITKTLK